MVKFESFGREKGEDERKKSVDARGYFLHADRLRGPNVKIDSFLYVAQ